MEIRIYKVDMETQKTTMTKAERSLSGMVSKLGLVDAGAEARRVQKLRPSAIGAERIAILNDEGRFAAFMAGHNAL